MNAMVIGYACMVVVVAWLVASHALHDSVIWHETVTRREVRSDVHHIQYCMV